MSILNKTKKNVMKEEIERLTRNNKVLTERNYDLNKRCVEYQKQRNELSNLNLQLDEQIKGYKKEIKVLKSKLTKSMRSVSDEQTQAVVLGIKKTAEQENISIQEVFDNILKEIEDERN